SSLTDEERIGETDDTILDELPWNPDEMSPKLLEENELARLYLQIPSYLKHSVDPPGSRRVEDRVKEIALEAVLTDVAMYAMAEKYLINELKALAKDKFESWGHCLWSHGVASVIRAI